MNASLSVEDRRVLLRSTEAKSDAANGMDQRIGLAAVDLPANTADIDINDIGRGIEMQIPHVLEEHRSRNHLTDIARQIFQQLKLARQQFYFSTAPAGDPRQQVDLQVTDAQHGLLDHGGAAARQRIDASQHLAGCERLYQVVVTACAQTAHAIIDFAES